jgi:fermentation-respiration switch protein FrsA (DUF1100 family)
MRNILKALSIITVLLITAACATHTGVSEPITEGNEITLESGKNRVFFKSQGVMLAGDLYLPEGFDESKKYPTVIFSGPLNQVKEQMGAVYAQKMAAIGYVFLSFDHLGYGDSEGEVRNNENFSWKSEGIRDGISYLRTLPFVDRSRLYGLGGCASGGYMPIVATTDKRMAAIATVSGMMDNMGTYFGGMPREMITGLFKDANEARQRAYESGEVEYYDLLGVETISEEQKAVDEGYDFYMTERAGAVTYPNYSHLIIRTIMEDTPLTSATVLAPYLYTPYLGIYGEKAIPAEGEVARPDHTGLLTVNFYEAASEPKELFEIPGATHVALYDIDEYVDQAVAKMDEFFKKYSIQ